MLIQPKYNDHSNHFRLGSSTIHIKHLIKHSSKVSTTNMNINRLQFLLVPSNFGLEYVRCKYTFIISTDIMTCSSYTVTKSINTLKVNQKKHEGFTLQFTTNSTTNA